MKPQKFVLFMLLLICSLINISGNNAPIGIAESSNDSKRTLEEQIDNYIILQFNKEVSYEEGKFLYTTYDVWTYDYNESISYIKNGNNILYRNSQFTVNSNTKLEVHFNQTFESLNNFLDADLDENFKNLIYADFSHFDASSVTNMDLMFNNCSSLRTLCLQNFKTSKVISMYQLFNGCSSLKTLYLSDFDTSSVSNFGYMFYNCTSLKYLIISNFNFDNGHYSKDHFIENLEKLEYIDISNIKDYYTSFKKFFVKNFNNKENLTVCQGELKYIDNKNAKYECLRDDDIDDNFLCNNIQKTIPLIQTTIPKIQTTIPIIQTTIPLIQTTIPKIQTTIPKIQTTIPQILSTIPQIITTIPQIQTTIPQIITTNPQIITTIPQILTTIPLIRTTVPRIQTTIPKARNEQTSLILLGFNNFRLSSSTICFIIVFAQILNEVYSQKITVILITIYSNLRTLEEKEVECYLMKKNTTKTNIASFFCETDITNSNIKQVKIIPKFNFIYQNNVTVIGTTPYARMFMNNLQDISDKYDNLENYKLYILDHSVYNKLSTCIYNITGVMNQEPKTKLEGKNINLMINLESEDEIKTESNCTISKNNENYYTLNCELRHNTDGDLNAAISFINDEEILVVNFVDKNLNKNSTIRINIPSEKYFNRNHSKSLKTGEIIALILPIVFVLAAIIIFVIYLKKKNNPDKNESTPITDTIRSLNIKKI